MSMSGGAIDALGALLDDRLRRGRKLALLVGAGLSRRPPSNLPVVFSMLAPILRELIPMPDVAAELLDAENPRRRNTKDFLRFETFCELLVKQGIDRELAFLSPLGDCRAVNENHLLLAGLIDRGHLVFTTNFDSLVELACARLGFQPDVLAYTEDYARFLDRPSRRPLFKLHGSLEVDGKPSRDSLRACLDQIVRAGTNDRVRLEEPKRRVLERALRDCDLLVLGYSGADDLDIVPALARIPALGSKLLWVNHTPPSRPQQMMAGLAIEASAPRDTHGHHLAERTRLLAALVRDGRRHPDDVLLADLDTDAVRAAVAAACGLRLEAPTDPPFAFDPEAFATRWLGRHLPSRLQRCYFGSHLLAERERYQDAMALYDECMASATNVADRLKAAAAKVNMLLRLERFFEADDALTAAEAEVRAAGEPEILSGHLHQVGYVRYNLGRTSFDGRRWSDASRFYDQALAAYEESLRIAEQRGAHHEVSVTLHQLGLLHVNHRQPKRFQLLADLERGLGGSTVLFSIYDLDVPGEKLSLRMRWLRLRSRLRRRFPALSRLAKRLRLFQVESMARHDRRRGKRCYRQAAAIAKTHGLLSRYAESVGQLASLLHLDKDYRGEVAALDDALELVEPLGQSYLLAALYGQLGRGFLYLRDWDAAVEALVVAAQHAPPGAPFAAEIARADAELRAKMGAVDHMLALAAARKKSQAALVAAVRKAARRRR